MLVARTLAARQPACAPDGEDALTCTEARLLGWLASRLFSCRP